jgi:hypothetical protein
MKIPSGGKWGGRNGLLMLTTLNKKWLLPPILALLFLLVCYIIEVFDSDFFLNNPRYRVIIVNNSSHPVFFRGSPSLISCGVYGNEKIYHVTLAIDDVPDTFEGYRGHSLYFDINTKIDRHKTKTFRLHGDVNYKNNYYEREKEVGVLTHQYEEFCSNIYFLLYFTRRPYAINTYTEYVEIMKDAGYVVTGYFEKNKVFFSINDTELQINENIITDPLHFVNLTKSAKILDTTFKNSK